MIDPAGETCQIEVRKTSTPNSHEGRGQEQEVMRSIVIDYVHKVRSLSPLTGCQKLYIMCQTLFGDLFTVGRDSFYRLLREYGLMLRLKKSRVRTTDSTHPYPRYPDPAKDLVPVQAGVLWVTDTYVRLWEGRFYFLSLITDACSLRITGWKLESTLEYVHTFNALETAIESSGYPLFRD